MTILLIVTLIFLGMILEARGMKKARAWKAMLISIALPLSVMISAPASAAPFFTPALGGQRFYAGAVFSGPVTGNVILNLNTALGPGFGPAWNVQGTFRETEKVIGVNDKLDIFGTRIRHVAGPDPGEAANVNSFRLTPDINIQAGVGGAVPGRIFIQPLAEIVEHKGTVNNVEVIHFDGGLSSFSAGIDANGRDINSSLFLTVGGHYRERPDFRQAMLQPMALPTEVAGLAALVIEPSTGRFDLSLSVENLSMSEIDSAQIRLGSPSNPGIPVFDLMPSSFVDVDGLGTSRLIGEDSFPISSIPDLTNGNAFVEIVSGQGRLTGQLEAVQVIPEPSQASLFVTGMLGLIGYSYWIRRREKRMLA